MIKILTILEKSKAFWYLLGISIFFFILRLPSLMEPLWYGDEGIYQVIGAALQQGSSLYTQIWDNKPPFLYLLYALFNGEQMSLRLVSIVFGIGALIAFFYLAQKLFGKLRISMIITTVFVVLFGTPLIEGNIANAENFMLLPIIGAALLVNVAIEKKAPLSRYLLFFSGLLLGFAFMFKTVALFDLLAFVAFLKLVLFASKASMKTILLSVAFFLLGFVLPVCVTLLYFASQGTVGDFVGAAFGGNVSYVGHFNTFIFPQGLLILKTIALLLGLGIVVWKRKAFSRVSLFITLWLLFSAYSAFFSQRPYTHYMLVMLPSFCLFIGLIFQSKKNKHRHTLIGILAGITLLLVVSFPFYGLGKTGAYYGESIAFATGMTDVQSYRSFFDSDTPRDYEVASFIRQHIHPNDQVFIWGDSAQIYYLAKKIPQQKYTVAYHIQENRERLDATQTYLDTQKPRYIVVLSEAPQFPFATPLYMIKYTVKGATIYERTL